MIIMRRIDTRWSTGVIGLVAGVVAMGTLVGCGNDTKHQNQSLRMIAQSGAAPTTVQYPGNSVTLAPPAAGSSPAVTAAQALSAYQQAGIFPGAASQSPPDIQLYDFSDNVMGDLQPDRSIALKYQHVLAWAVIFHSVPYQGLGGGDNHPIPEDLVTMVDANNGNILEAFAE
jgi:hypothetical protein